MAGVVVGVSRTNQSRHSGRSGAALLWACAEAALRDDDLSALIPCPVAVIPGSATPTAR
jgi:hypothetical protein